MEIVNAEVDPYRPPSCKAGLGKLNVQMRGPQQLAVGSGDLLEFEAVAADSSVTPPS